MKINSSKCQEELEKEGVVPKKYYGQVFTTDPVAIESLISSIKASVKTNSKIIEIGSGLGYISLPLIESFDDIVLVEYDSKLFKILNKKIIQDENIVYLKEKSSDKIKFFTHKKNRNKRLKLINIDILELEIPEEEYLLVGNIPFHVSGKLYRKFMSDVKHKPYGMIFITDLQYAKTLAGQPPRCYRISLQAQGYGDIEIIEEIPPTSVYPQPKVTCCLMKIIQNKTKLPKNFWRVVNHHWEHFPTPEVESPKTMGLKRWIELCEKTKEPTD